MKNNRSPLVTIFLTVFIDMLGVGIIIPVLPALFFEPETSIVASSFTSDQRSLLYGALLAVFPLLQFFGAPMLGSLSDRYGRKPVLLVSQTGTMLGYILRPSRFTGKTYPCCFSPECCPVLREEILRSSFPVLPT